MRALICWSSAEAPLSDWPDRLKSPATSAFSAACLRSTSRWLRNQVAGAALASRISSTAVVVKLMAKVTSSNVGMAAALSPLSLRIWRLKSKKSEPSARAGNMESRKG